MSRHQQFLNPMTTPKVAHLDKKNPDTKIEVKSEVRTRGNIENNSCSTTWIDPRTVLPGLRDGFRGGGAVPPHRTKFWPILANSLKIFSNFFKILSIFFQIFQDFWSGPPPQKNPGSTPAWTPKIAQLGSQKSLKLVPRQKLKLKEEQKIKIFPSFE